MVARCAAENPSLLKCVTKQAAPAVLTDIVMKTNLSDGQALVSNKKARFTFYNFFNCFEYIWLCGGRD